MLSDMSSHINDYIMRRQENEMDTAYEQNKGSDQYDKERDQFRSMDEIPLESFETKDVESLVDDVADQDFKKTGQDLGRKSGKVAVSAGKTTVKVAGKVGRAVGKGAGKVAGVVGDAMGDILPSKLCCMDLIFTVMGVLILIAQIVAIVLVMNYPDLAKRDEILKYTCMSFFLFIVVTIWIFAAEVPFSSTPKEIEKQNERLRSNESLLFKAGVFFSFYGKTGLFLIILVMFSSASHLALEKAEILV